MSTEAGQRRQEGRRHRHEWDDTRAGEAREEGMLCGSRRTCFLCSIQVRLLLRFSDVLLVSYPLVSEPIGHLDTGTERQEDEERGMRQVCHASHKEDGGRREERGSLLERL